MKKLIYLFLLFAVALNINAANSNYPSHWWEEVDRSTAPGWEVLPQDAKEGEVILSKRNELGILSNFAATPFTYKGINYQSLEGFWQSLKYPESDDDIRATFEGIEWPYTRFEVEQMTGFLAKKAGGYANSNMREMGIDWVTFKGKRIKFWTVSKGVHYKLIKDALRTKALQNPEVMKVLLSTGDLVLRPDHQMGDAPPAWFYNKIWMELREEFNN
ncbi:NADAR family protein [Halobacteriovorax sp. HLS]|uniref:NADAR family protein n=1 Tax=Halobacteriovorax sp. HLS TaxID=2234000 RepID=UPI0019D4EAA1|nr:NADAR family protein [Halobacteriovorax sp. HLS]